MLNNGFEGWYFKQQANGRTLALIPGRSRDTAFIQVVTDDRVWHVGYPLSDYHKGNIVTIAGNRFTRDGIRLNIHGEGLNLAGELAYTNLTPLKSDIMGPFRFFPMECRHSVISMGHRVVGDLNLNGEPLNFKGRGYIEWAFLPEKLHLGTVQCLWGRYLRDGLHRAGSLCRPAFYRVYRRGILQWKRVSAGHLPGRTHCRKHSKPD